VPTYAQTTNRLMYRPGLRWLQQRLAFLSARGQTASGRRRRRCPGLQWKLLDRTYVRL